MTSFIRRQRISTPFFVFKIFEIRRAFSSTLFSKMATMLAAIFKMADSWKTNHSILTHFFVYNIFLMIHKHSWNYFFSKWPPCWQLFSKWPTVVRAWVRACVCLIKPRLVNHSVGLCPAGSYYFTADMINWQCPCGWTLRNNNVCTLYALIWN